MLREVTGILQAWDTLAQAPTVLEPGAILCECRIQRNSQSAVDDGAEPYVIHFESEGRAYWSSLPHFQPRTRPFEELATSEALAV